jgi:hypothetical protein
VEGEDAPGGLPEAADEDDDADRPPVGQAEIERGREDDLAGEREDERDQKRVDGDDTQSCRTGGGPDHLLDDLQLEEPLQDGKRHGGHYAALPVPSV